MDQPEQPDSSEVEFSELDALLTRLSAGEADAEGRLLELVHARMRAIARRIMRTERPDHTLQPTALVNEAWLKLSAGREQAYRNREHFFSMAATAMRRVLVDHARTRTRLRRTVPPEELNRMRDAVAVEQRTQQMLALDQALTRLAEHDARMAKIIELRCFCDLSVEETAALLNISPSTVKREFQAARALLDKELRG